MERSAAWDDQGQGDRTRGQETVSGRRRKAAQKGVRGSKARSDGRVASRTRRPADEAANFYLSQPQLPVVDHPGASWTHELPAEDLGAADLYTGASPRSKPPTARHRDRNSCS